MAKTNENALSVEIQIISSKNVRNYQDIKIKRPLLEDFGVIAKKMKRRRQGTKSVLWLKLPMRSSVGHEFLKKPGHFSYFMIDLLTLIEIGDFISLHSFTLMIAESEVLNDSQDSSAFLLRSLPPDIITKFCGPSRWKELSKETSSKILPCGDESCW
nr:hypothetical protein [Tanacetum cinerariifolium]